MYFCFAVLVYMVDWLSEFLFSPCCGVLVVDIGVYLVLVFVRFAYPSFRKIYNY